MIKKFSAVVCVMGLGLAATAANAASDNPKLVARLAAATATIQAISAAPDRGIPNEIAESADCVAVIPGFKKAAFIVGADYGQGVATCRTASGKWSSPVFIQMTGGSFGFQIGGQSTDYVMVAVNQKGMQDLLKNKFKIGADAAASAGPVGRNAAAGTDWKLNSELLTYSRSKGLFAGVDLGGVVVTQNADDTRTFYGTNQPFETVLKGDVATPASAREFVRTVANYFSKSKTVK